MSRGTPHILYGAADGTIYGMAYSYSERIFINGETIAVLCVFSPSSACSVPADTPKSCSRTRLYQQRFVDDAAVCSIFFLTIQALLMIPMNEIAKDKLHRFIARFGLRLLNPKSYRFEHDASNYRELDPMSSVVIFDVGANIGQTSISFRHAFPNAKVYAFEPFKAVFESLSRNVAKDNRIYPFHMAVGPTASEIVTTRVTDSNAQLFRVAPAAGGATDTERVRMTTITEFCATNDIPRIDILKTDTEGCDLGVLKGAEGMLDSNRIGSILSEASIRLDDEHHSRYSDLHAYLKGFGFELFSIYAIRHAPDGRMDYFNALFKPKQLCRTADI